jgi:type IV pilus assembly protein PilM
LINLGGGLQLSSLLAIDVGKKNIHMAEGSFSKNVVMVEKVANLPVPEGVFTGEIIDNPDLLAEAIANAVKTFGFRAKDAIITLDGYGSVIRDIDLPAAKPKEIASMIRTEMIQTYHVEPEDVVQYKIIDKVTSENGAQLNRYRATAINREIVEAYHRVIADARLKPVAMDININAIDKLLAGEVMINDELTGETGTMIIDIGDVLTTVYIISKGKPLFFRQLDFGSGEIEKIISEKTFEPEQDIKKMKEDGFDFFGTGDEGERYAEILRPFFYSMADEIRKIIGFYASRSNNGNIRRIFLCGGGSNLTGIAGFCEANFGVPAEQIISISTVKSKDSVIPIASYMNAIGALIRY